MDSLKVYNCMYRTGEQENGMFPTATVQVIAKDRGRAQSIVADKLKGLGLLELNKKKCGALAVAINEVD